MRGLDRRLARLEAMRECLDDLVDPEHLQRMAAIVLHDPLDAKLRAEAERVVAQPIEDVEAERARVREKIFADGPHVPAVEHPGVECDARRTLRQKLLPDEVPQAAGVVPA